MASKKSGVNKSQFVREQAPSLSAAEVVEKAKAKGISLTPGFVYAVRSAAKTAKAKGSTQKKVGRPPSTGGGNLEAMIRSIVRSEIKAFFSER